LADDFPPDEEGLGFSNNADALNVSSLLAEGYMNAAATMGTDAVAKLATLFPCSTQTSGEDVCARQFVQSFGKRAFRRPLSDEETTRYFGLYTLARQQGKYEDGISLVVQAFVQSPFFLYRVESDPPGAVAEAVAPVSAYELASRLSYFLLGSMPDDTLLAAADQSQLSTPDQITVQAQRLLQDPRARLNVGTFHRQWLDLNEALEAPKAADLYPSWNPQLASDLFTESETFVDQVFWNDGQLSSLLNAPYTFLNTRLASFYGVPDPGTTTFSKVMLSGLPRAGLLTEGTFLAGHANPDQSSPVRRGKFVREQLLCQPVPPPPNNIVIMPPMYDPASSTRQRYAAHEVQPLCAGCHVAMDPIGLGFEAYDATGAFRTKDGPAAVDASGTLKSTDVDGPFNGAVELASKLAGSAEVADCVATQWFRFANGRSEDSGDLCALTALRQTFKAKQYDMRSLPLSVVTSDTFRYRKAIGAQP
jgi:hypothetical protein